MPPGGLGSGRYVGRIKSFNPRHGFGFIDCPDAYARFGRDVFIHKAQLGDLEVGSEVTFYCESNKDGMPQARDILHLNGHPPGPTPPHLLAERDEDKGMGKGGPDEHGRGSKGGRERRRNGSGGKGGGAKGRRRVNTDAKGAPIVDDGDGGD